jgi:hypothetical protein
MDTLGEPEGCDGVVVTDQTGAVIYRIEQRREVPPAPRISGRPCSAKLRRSDG